MRQIYAHYTNEDQDVWTTLFKRQYDLVQGGASKAHLRGLELISFQNDQIPNFDHINRVLRSETGWELAVVPGIVPDYTFFELMAHRRFPATTWLRKRSELDYLEEPDMFHDVFAHVPLLTSRPFTHFLEELSQIGLSYCGDDWAIERISRIYWFSVEFGLIQEQEGLRIYGAGILSSSGETQYSLSDEPKRYPFHVEQMMSTPYRKDVFQDRYFIVNSYEQLYESVPQIKDFLKKRSDHDVEAQPVGAS